jgi:hypothetical protein
VRNGDEGESQGEAVIVDVYYDTAHIQRFSKVMAVQENDLVATGMLPVISNRQAGSLSHQSILGAETHCV